MNIPWHRHLYIHYRYDVVVVASYNAVLWWHSITCKLLPGFCSDRWKACGYEGWSKLAPLSGVCVGMANVNCTIKQEGFPGLVWPTSIPACLTGGHLFRVFNCLATVSTVIQQVQILVWLARHRMASEPEKCLQDCLMSTARFFCGSAISYYVIGNVQLFRCPPNVQVCHSTEQVLRVCIHRRKQMLGWVQG